MSRNVFLSLALSACFFIALAIIAYKEREKPTGLHDYDMISYMSPMADLAQAALPGVLKTEILNAIQEGRITPNELDQLDFTLPSDNGFGDNVEYEVFNSHSPRSILNDKTYKLPLFDQAYIDALTVRPGIQPFFSMRQYGCGDGYVCQSIALVFPHIDLSKCQLEQKNGWSIDVVDVPADTSFINSVGNIAADAGTFFKACLRTKNKEGYLMLPVIRRFKEAPAKDWQVMYQYKHPSSRKMEK